SAAPPKIKCSIEFIRSMGRPVKIKLAWIGKTKEPAIQALTEEYLKRIGRYAEVAGLALKDEAAILSLATGERQQKKERHKLVLADSRGNNSHPKSWPSFWSASR